MKLKKYRSSKEFIDSFLNKDDSNFLILREFDSFLFNKSLKEFYFFLKSKNLLKIQFKLKRYKIQKIRKFFSKNFSSLFIGKFYFIFFEEIFFLEHFLSFLKEKKLFCLFYFIFYKNRFFSLKYLEIFLSKNFIEVKIKLFLFLLFFVFSFFFKLYGIFFLLQIKKLNFFILNGNIKSS